MPGNSTSSPSFRLMTRDCLPGLHCMHLASHDLITSNRFHASFAYIADAGPSQASAFLTMYNIIRGTGHMPSFPPNQDELMNIAVGATIE